MAPSRPGSDSLSEPIPVASRAATGRLLAQPAVFHILIALADRDRHGYSIMQDVAARTAGKVQLSAGTLYSSIRRMLEQGPIEELAGSPDPSSTGERRRYYRLTRFGRRAAADESGD